MNPSFFSTSNEWSGHVPDARLLQFDLHGCRPCWVGSRTRLVPLAYYIENPYMYMISRCHYGITRVTPWFCSSLSRAVAESLLQTIRPSSRPRSSPHNFAQGMDRSITLIWTLCDLIRSGSKLRLRIRVVTSLAPSKVEPCIKPFPLSANAQMISG
jgi:hypothetical protein